MLEKIILIRNIFYKLFFIGFLFYVFTVVFFLLNNVWAVNIIVNNFHMIRAEVYFLIAYFIGWAKMVLIMFFLMPALALQWTGYSLKEDNK